MKRTLMLALALSAWLLCAATGVESVRSTDTSKTSNTVSIELSDPAQYSVQQLPGGKGVRLTIKNVSSLGGSPQYPRLSEVIDVVSARMEGGNAVIDIKTMGDYDISHGSNSARDRITVSVISGAATPPAPKPAAAPAPIPKTEIPPSAMPKKVGLPDNVSSRPQLPAPAPSDRTPGSVPPQEQPLAQTTPPPLVPPPTTEETKTGEEQLEAKALPETPAESASGTAIEPANGDKITKGNLPLWLILAAAALLILLVVLKYFLAKRPEIAAGTSEPIRDEKPAEGRTLLLDPETRQRMVQKLLDQGWSSSEIAREMRLGVQEVEAIVARLKGLK